MKKKVLALVMILAFLMVPMTGCGSFDESSEFIENAGSDTEFYYSVQVYGLDEGVLVVTSVDESGETIVEETGSYGWFGTPDMTIGQMMEEWGIVSIEAKCEGYEHLGWIAKENVIEVDENGFEEYVEKDLFDGKLFTTEEMMSQELLDKDIYFYSVWDLVCGGCEEHKICDVYYIDDERYFVCKDCYEEFATGMGLI